MIEGPIPEGLTFDDVLLLPGKSSILPTEVDTRTCFTRKVSLNIPLASAAMDTVTESHLALAIARQGGIGSVEGNEVTSAGSEPEERDSGRAPAGPSIDSAQDVLVAASREKADAYLAEQIVVARAQ